MPQKNESEPPLISKKYLYMLPVIVVGLGLNLAFNPEVRSRIGLKSGSGLKLNFFRKKAVPPVAAPQGMSAFSPDDFKAFTESFTQHEVPDLYITPPSDTPTTGGGSGSDEPPPPPPPPHLWPVHVQGTFLDMHDRWTAIISGNNIRVGDTLTSGVPSRCNYLVLAIGRQCVWVMVILPGQADAPALPDVDWPDVALIELDRTGLIRREYVPARVRLGNGDTLGKGDILEYSETDARFVVKELWATGVVFEAEKDSKRVEFACTLVTP